MLDFAKKVWGVGMPKGFRLAAWGLALTVYGIYSYDQFLPSRVNDRAAIKLNKDDKESLPKSS
jgi:hypothetical protein